MSSLVFNWDDLFERANSIELGSQWNREDSNPTSAVIDSGEVHRELSTSGIINHSSNRRLASIDMEVEVTVRRDSLGTGGTGANIFEMYVRSNYSTVDSDGRPADGYRINWRDDVGLAIHEIDADALTVLDTDSGNLPSSDVKLRARVSGVGSSFLIEVFVDDVLTVSSTASNPNLEHGDMNQFGFGVHRSAGDAANNRHSVMADFTVQAIGLETAFDSSPFLSVKRINIPFANVSGSQNLANFPLYVDLSNMNDGHFFENSNSDGSDVAFAIGNSRDNLRKVARELVSIDPTAKTGEAWVRMSIVSVTEDTRLWMFYENTNGEEPAEGVVVDSVWKASYGAVIHDPSTGVDSSGYANTATPTNVSQDADGAIGDAGEYNGTDSVSVITTASEIDNIFDGGGVLSFWVKPDSGGVRNILNVDGGGDPVSVNITESGGLHDVFFTQRWSTGQRTWATPKVMPTGEWSRVDILYDNGSPTANDAVFIINGTVYNPVDSGGGTGTRLTDAAFDKQFGGRTGQFLDGRMDEVRFNSKLETEDFVLTEHANTEESSSFYEVSGTISNIPFAAQDFKNFKEITIPFTNVDGTVDLNDFPMLVPIEDIDDANDVFGTALANGADIVFAQYDEEFGLLHKLDRELVALSGSAGEAWVRMSRLGATVDTKLRMYWENPNGSEPAAGVVVSDVFNQYWKSVVHDPSDGTDSSMVGSAASVTAVGQVTGKIGNAGDFVPASSSNVSYPDNSEFTIEAEDCTFETWIRPDDVSDVQIASHFDGGASNQRAWRLFINASSQLQLQLSNDGTSTVNVTGATVLSVSTEYHISWTKSGDSITTYINGVQEQTGTLASVFNPATDLLIGAQRVATSIDEPFDGWIDEPKFAVGVAQSTSWLLTERSNQNAPSSFYSVGAKQDVFDARHNSPGWDGYQEFSIPLSLVVEDLTDFPAYVDLSNMPTILFSTSRGDGLDLVVVRASDPTTELPREVVSFDVDAETGELHFNTKTLSSSSDNEFLIYFGNCDVSKANDPAVWEDVGYGSVWHLDSLTLGGNDSTSNGNDFNSVNGAAGPSVVPASVGDGIDFNGTDENIEIPRDASIDDIFAGGPGVISAIINPNSDGGSSSGRILDNDEGTNDGFAFRVRLEAGGFMELSFFLRPDSTRGNWTTNTTKVEIGAPNHVVLVHDGSQTGQDPLIYVNGALQAVDTFTSNSVAYGGGGTEDFRIATSNANTALTFDGTIDEIRTATNVTFMTAGRIFTEFTNLLSPSSFIVLGDQFDIHDPTEWEYHKDITIPDSVVDGPDDLIDYILTVDFDDIDDAADFYGVANEAGTDIVFTEVSTGRKLQRQLENFSASGSTGIAHVVVPRLKANEPTVIRLTFGNEFATETDDQIWGDFLSVIHDPFTGTDSTVNGNDGAPTSVTTVAGKLGLAGDYNGTSSFNNLGTNATVDNIFDNGGLFSFWIRPEGTGTENIYTVDDASDGISFSVIHSGGLHQIVFTQRYGAGGSNNFTWFTPFIMPINTFSRVDIFFDNSSDSNDPIIYINGLLQSLSKFNTGTGTRLSDAGFDKHFGGRSTQFLDGRLDEVRFRKLSVLDVDELTTSYANQNAPGSFYSVGALVAEFDSSSWSFQADASVQAAQMTSTENGFLGMIDLSTLPAGFFTSALADASDVVLVRQSAPTARLFIDIRRFNKAGNTGQIWFNAPEILVGESFSLYSGNASATEGSRKKAYPPDHELAIQSPDVVDAEDSTCNVFELDASNAAAQIAGQVGNAGDYDGTNDVLEILDRPEFSVVDSGSADLPFSMSVLVNMDDDEDFIFFDKGGVVSTDREYVLASFGATGIFTFRIFDSDGDFIGRTFTGLSADVGSYHTYAITYDGTQAASGIKLYRDGVQVDTTDDNSGAYDQAQNTTNSLKIGNSPISSLFSDGKIDVSRWYSSVRTVDQLFADHSQLINNGAFWGTWVDQGAATAAISGTAAGSTEQQIRELNRTVVIDLTGDTFVASGPTFDGIRQDIIDGITAGASPTNGWNNVVRDSGLVVGNVVRNSDTQVQVNLQGYPGYQTDSTETITVTVPASALAGAVPLVGTPTFNVTTLAEEAVLTGTLDGSTEQQLRENSRTIILTLANATYVNPFTATEQAAIIAGLDGDDVTGTGFDAAVRPNIPNGNVVRTSATVCTITVPATPGYAISSTENITATIPAVAIVSPEPITATPDATLTAVVESAARSGTATAADEDDIRTGSTSLVVDLTNVTFVDAFDNTIRQAVIDGLSGNGPGGTGFNDAVRANMVPANVVRNSATQMTITIPASAGYGISSDETITPTIPATAMKFPTAIATPTFDITALVESAAISGTVTTGRTENEIRVDGSLQLIVDITNATFLDAGAGFEAIRQDIIDGIDGLQAGGTSWNTAVRDQIAVTAVARVSATRVTVEFDGFTGFAVSSGETVEFTVPASALKSPTEITATPTFAVSSLAETASPAGSLTSSDEADVRAGTTILLLNLVNAHWADTGGAFEAARQDIIDGLDGDDITATGWDTVVQTAITVGAVQRISNTQVQITVPQVATYDIASTETITPTIPASALKYPNAIVSTTFDIASLAASATISGTVITAAPTEADIVAGAKTIEIDILNATFIADSAPFRQSIIDGITSAQSESNGWNAEVKTALDESTDVNRVSGTKVIVTLPAVAAYAIDNQETITVTIPDSAVDTSGAIVATPTFNVTPNVVTASIAGTLADDATETEIRTNTPTQTLIVTVADDTLVATFNAAIQDAIIAGLTSAASESTGWNAEVRDNASVLPSAAVVRDSDTQFTVTLQAGATNFGITSDETVTVTIPATALVNSTSAIIASSTFDLTRVGPTVTNVTPDQGREIGGEVVVIAGNDFTGATAISIGGTNVPIFNVDSDTQITITTPARAPGNNLQVLVTTPLGSSPNTAADDFDYIAEPAITSFTSAAPKISIGDSTTLTAVFSNGTGVVDNGVGSVVSGVPELVSPVLTTLFELTVTNILSVEVTAQTQIEVIALPTVDAGADKEANIDQNVELAGSGTGDVITFLWTVDSKPAGSTATFVDDTDEATCVKADIAGTYVLRLTVTDSIGKTAFDTITFTVLEGAFVEVLKNTIRSRWEALIEGPCVVPTQYDNLPFTKPLNSVWVRLKVNVLDSRQVSTGSRDPANNRFRTFGAMVAEIRSPVETGDQRALEIFGDIDAEFRNKTDQGVQFRKPTLQDTATRDGKFWLVTVLVPFYSDQTS